MLVEIKESMTMSQGTLPELFAQEQLVTSASLEEARELCETVFHYSRPEIAVAQISLDDHLELRVKGDHYRLTEKAFDDLCTLVNLPVRFAKQIPTDLVATIITRLQLLHQQVIVPVHRDDIVVGIVDPAKWTQTRAKIRRPHYLPVSNAALLHMIEKIWTPRVDSLRIAIADSGLQIEILNDHLSIEPRVGDITRVGLVMTNSETGGPLPQARGYTLRLVCSNGATVPQQFGSLRFESDWRVNFDLRLAAFAAGLRDFAFDVSLLRQSYEHIAVEHLTDQFFYDLYRQARYVYRRAPDGDALTDGTLGVTAERRREIVGEVRRRQVGQRRVGARLSGPQQTSLAAWDVFNSITATARDERVYSRRVALERLAGDVFRAYSEMSPN